MPRASEQPIENSPESSERRPQLPDAADRSRNACVRHVFEIEYMYVQETRADALQKSIIRCQGMYVQQEEARVVGSNCALLPLSGPTGATRQSMSPLFALDKMTECGIQGEPALALSPF